MIVYSKKKPRRKAFLITLGLGAIGLVVAICGLIRNVEKPVSESKSDRVHAENTLASSKIFNAASSPVNALEQPAANTPVDADLNKCDSHSASTSLKIGEDEVTSALKSERLKIANGLMGSGSDAERAAGIAFLVRASTYINYADCQGPNCAAAAKEDLRLKNEAALNQLVSIASKTNSPSIYSWALNACSSEAVRYAREMSCATLSRQKGAALDPANGWGWLSVAAEANGQGNLSGVEDALFRASKADKWTPPADLLKQTLLSRVPREADPLVTLGLLNDIKSVGTEMSIGGLNTISSLCPATSNANRKQICQELASKILASTGDLLGLSVGLKVGERVGLSESQLKGKKDEYLKVSSLLPANSMTKSTNVLSGCRNSLPVIKFLKSSLLKGEIAALSMN